ncbi:MAG: hypothetical protein Q9169_002407 [Polycauliona sp. 2 TL-2023]
MSTIKTSSPPTLEQKDAASQHPAVPFSSLPLDSNGPRGNAWGRFGAQDELGTLNLLTGAVVAAAARNEIKSGVRISLDWPLTKPGFPLMGRDAMKHDIRRRGHDSRVVNDDVVTFNTQCSSQWDGLRHYGYLKERKYYNNTAPEQLTSSTVLGIDGVASNGGIVGRGVLLDYARFATRHNIQLSPFTNNAILLSDLKKLIQERNITFSPGDILFIRSGFTAAFDALLADERSTLAARETVEFAGVEATLETAEWLWENQFAAVAGDAIAWESVPLGGKVDCLTGLASNKPDVSQDQMPSLHQWLLAGWGMPIGEMFDLEKLAEHCEQEGRWSFFLSSVPLKVSRPLYGVSFSEVLEKPSHALEAFSSFGLTDQFQVPGGVASPPNAVAIF